MTSQIQTNMPVITPVPPIASVDQVSDTQLRRYAELVLARTGIRVSPQKKQLLSNRLRRRLRSTGIPTFEAYYRHLRDLPDHAPEWNAFVQEITTHETYLFRDEQQWKWFRDEYLPRLAATRPARGWPSLRIWSAACSTGDEPYTAACCVARQLDLSRWQVHILATDIGVGALEQAKAGLFGQRAMHRVSAEDRCRFFANTPDGERWQALPVLARLITFRQHNLMEPLREKPFDLVLLKNVLIYFDDQAKAAVMRNVRESLRPGGWLMIGTAEGTANMLRDFERLKPWLFHKPASQGTQP
jgi:chemotaxis protein methyltransferase CheR